MRVYSGNRTKRMRASCTSSSRSLCCPPTQVDEETSTPGSVTIPGNRNQVNSQDLSPKPFKTSYFQLFLSLFLAFPLLIFELPSFPILSLARIRPNTLSSPTAIYDSLMPAVRHQFFNKGRGDNDTVRPSGIFPPLGKFPCKTEWSEDEPGPGTIGNTLPIYPLTGDAKKPIMAADFQPPLLSSTAD